MPDDTGVSFVVEPGLKDDEVLTVDQVHEPMLLCDPAGPRTGQHVPKGFGLADPRHGIGDR